MRNARRLPLSGLWLAAALGSPLVPQSSEARGATPAVEIALPAEDFIDHQTSDPESAARVRSARDLAGGGWVTGWFDYGFTVATRGWYELAVVGSGAGVEYTLDPGSKAGPRQRYYGGNGASEGREKVGNLWLSAGAHRLRLQRYFWTGFPSIRRIELRASGQELGSRVAVHSASEIRIFRKNQCASLDILSGGSALAATLRIVHADSITGRIERSYDVPLPASANLVRQRFALPCDRDGFHQLWFGDGARDIPRSEMRILYYEVVETERGRARPREPDRTVAEIDCSGREPDYASGATRVASGSAGRYRESGDVGW